MQSLQKLSAILFLALVLMISAGCNTSKSAKGAVIGGAAGGLIGGAVTKGGKANTKGVIIGAAIGGTAGAIIGKYMDKQAKELEEEIPGAQVEKVETVDPETGETVTESVTVTFDGGVLFEFGKATLTTASRAELDRMAGVFARYPDTDILIDGHTDNVGTEQANQTLSERRSASVSDYLAEHNISRSRMRTKGYGEMRPVASNETNTGRAQNRRVEVAIKATEQLKKKAESGELTVPE